MLTFFSFLFSLIDLLRRPDSRWYVIRTNFLIPHIVLLRVTDILYLVFIITVSARGLANDNISEARRADLARQGVNSLELHLRGLGSKAQLTKWVLYSLVLWLLKSSVLHFFAVRLTVCCPLCT